jgi:phage gp46-like protein
MCGESEPWLKKNRTEYTVTVDLWMLERKSTFKQESNRADLKKFSETHLLCKCVQESQAAGQRGWWADKYAGPTNRCTCWSYQIKVRFVCRGCICRIEDWSCPKSLQLILINTLVKYKSFSNKVSFIH